ncbi:MAG: DegV family protein [Chloroflexota bacterium]
MPQVAIVTDTTACLLPTQIAQYRIELVPIELVFGDKVYRDVDLEPARFYTMLRQAAKPPTTVGSLPGPFLEAYRRASGQARNILCITESAKFSGMFNSARLAMETAREGLPGINISVMECTSAAAGQGLVVLAAAQAAAAGGSLAEVAGAAGAVMARVNLFAALDTLYYLVKGGRVPKAAGLANSVLKIKPVFTVHGGEAHTVALPRTTASAINQMLKLMKKKAGNEQPLHVAVMHADAPEQAVSLRDRITAQFRCTELFITEFTPVMAVHSGPGVIGVAFYGDG